MFASCVWQAAFCADRRNPPRGAREKKAAPPAPPRPPSPTHAPAPGKDPVAKETGDKRKGPGALGADRQEASTDAMMRDASTTTNNLVIRDKRLRVEPPVPPREMNAMDKTYVRLTTRSDDGLVFIPGVCCEDVDDDTGFGTLTGCVCYVMDGKTYKAASL